ncbi:nitroreductase family deazaflavin-dependent oxidoreductase [Streptosporangium sp. NPDC087985]|uniref:nitroreductase family deazaflavin-dependent oxidoreductase n=1 Tax=Streptosporangium sp. NPDC087985 TaxID=3366196 RepID=UPI003828BA3D
MTDGYRRPGWFTVRVLNSLTRWLGTASTLEVVRRQTGVLQRVPVNVLELTGDRYLVSMRGQTHWVRNLRAAGRCTLQRRGRRRAYLAVEVSGEQRSHVIAAYRGRWQVRRFFDGMPDPADHPVFRLDPVD